mgnify:FL=1
MAAKSTTGDNKLPIDWKIVSHDGPPLTNHVGCIIRNSFYIHGGVSKYGSTTASAKLYKLDLGSKTWQEVSVPGSPSLSHHACVVFEDRYMVLIGGWDGRHRVSTLHAYDAQESQWITLRDNGFPEGAGLSSHAAMVLKSGELLIIGREGSLRIQRRHGNAYILTGSVLRGEFTYRKMTNDTSSRSGHTVNSIDNACYIIGGRDDQLVESHAGYHGYSSKELDGNLTSKFVDITELVRPMTKQPCGRKNHVAVSGKGCIFIHGGETFDGRSREPVGDMYLLTVKPHLQFHKLDNSQIARASHVCVSNGDVVMFHGGIAGKNVVHGETYELTLAKP